MGTPHYLSPEMWRRQPYSFSADVWALGCMLHEMCTLRCVQGDAHVACAVHL